MNIRVNTLIICLVSLILVLFMVILLLFLCFDLVLQLSLFGLELSSRLLVLLGRASNWTT